MTTSKKLPLSKLVAPKKPAKKTVPKKEIVFKNEVAFVLDASGSMTSLSGALVKATNSWLDKLQKGNDELKQITNVTRVDFGVMNGSHGNVDIVKFSESIDDFGRLKTFNTRGNTPLFDAVTLTVNELSKFEKNTNTSMLIITITDGEENASSKENTRNIGKLLRSKQATDKYTFVFMVPPGRKSTFCREYEIPVDNVTEWENTVEGLRQAEEKTSAGISNYLTSRSRGLTAVNTFYSTPDLSDLTSREVKKTLTDIQNECSVYEVAKEIDIKTFVESKTGLPHNAKSGKCYYQLTKNEEVQPSKQVLIMEKGKRAIYGGTEARELIGLHNGALDKVKPGNHANYDIFIQSTSTNRILVRGTKLIIRG